MKRILLLLTLLLPSLLLRAQPAERTITNHLRGVYDSKICLPALSASRTFSRHKQYMATINRCSFERIDSRVKQEV